MSSKLDLNAIRKRAKMADNGHWFYEDGNIYTTTEVAPGCPSMIAEFVYRDEAEFIANARKDVFNLIAEVERLRKALEVRDDNDLVEAIEEAFGQRIEENAKVYAEKIRKEFERERR